MVRHGKAAAGWNVDPDPGLDETGRSQALAVASRLSRLGPLPVASSPLLRCQQTAFPLATAWKCPVVVESKVGEIPSPTHHTVETRGEWLRDVMAGTWSDVVAHSGDRYAAYRSDIAAFISGITTDTVVFSHFIAINAVVGAATNDDRVVIGHLDNCSVTVFDVGEGRLDLVEMGGEATTTIG